MITDIFLHRYRNLIIWEKITETEKRFLVQAFRIVEEQVSPYYYDGNPTEQSKRRWKKLHDELSMELGLQELYSKTFSYMGTNSMPQVHFYPDIDRCKKFVLADYDPSITADRFMKERISFIELAFRLHGEELNKENIELPQKIQEALNPILSGGTRGIRLPGNREDGIKAWNRSKNEAFRSSVEELNVRLRQADYQLNYHNGVVQISKDVLEQKEIETPFWHLVSLPNWKNVEVDMKEALDLRDNNGRDPSFYAARALESTIKIISEHKGWTHGKEKGAQNYLDNLAKKENNFIDDWEKKSLEDFFRSIRNPFGHGPGSKKMPKLTSQQTDWAIGFCMLWIKSLIQRI
jgi:hypothetical protein